MRRRRQVGAKNAMTPPPSDARVPEDRQPVLRILEELVAKAKG